MNTPPPDSEIEHIRNEIEYILDDDTTGEVRVTYLIDGHSEIKQARVLLVDDIMRVVEGSILRIKDTAIHTALLDLDKALPEKKPDLHKGNIELGWMQGFNKCRDQVKALIQERLKHE